VLTDWAEVDLAIGAEDAVETVLPPEHGRGRVALGNASQSGGVLSVFEELETGGFNGDGGRNYN
jgi:hypothetical protein